MTGALALQAADTPVSIATIYDRDLAGIERELVPLVEAMPADRFQFVPKDGEFGKSRTFAQQATHIATVLYEVAAGIRGEKMPVPTGTNENGDAKLRSKDEIIAYVKAAFTYAHKAMASLTRDNLTDLVPSPFGDGTVARGRLATIATWHSYDHYGQMAVYMRLNHIIPPASR